MKSDTDGALLLLPDSRAPHPRLHSRDDGCCSLRSFPCYVSEMGVRAARRNPCLAEDIPLYPDRRSRDQGESDGVAGPASRR